MGADLNERSGVFALDQQPDVRAPGQVAAPLLRCVYDQPHRANNAGDRSTVAIYPPDAVERQWQRDGTVVGGHLAPRAARTVSGVWRVTKHPT